MDIHAALRSYTAWAAPQVGAGDRSGVLEVGKSADIAVWDRDPYVASAADLKDMVCDMTLFRNHPA